MTGVETARPAGGGGQMKQAMRWSELKEGAQAEPLVLGPLTRTDFVRYPGASGDMNPIHHDETVTARGLRGAAGGGDVPRGGDGGARGRVARAGRTCAVRASGGRTRWPGDVLTITATVTRTYEENGEKRADVELACARQGAGVAVQGWMTFAFAE